MMRIVNRKTFLSMPEGTLFSKYEPQITDGFGIKGNTLWHQGRPIDFREQDLLMPVDCMSSDELMDILDKGERDGDSFAVNLDCQGRDGCFDEDQLFLVWDRADVEKLIGRLQAALGGGDE
jgi:hypothetical protein